MNQTVVPDKDKKKSRRRKEKIVYILTTISNF
jgi:hypothetical protein